MNPIQIVYYYFGKVFGFVKSGLDWRRMVEAYETEKSKFVAQNYRFQIFPLEFISIPRSAFAYDQTVPGSRGDYAQTVIKVKDIYPFILDAHSSAVFVRSFRKSDPSAFDGLLLQVGHGYVLGTDGRFQPIDANHVGYDKPGTPGILTFSIDNDMLANREAHSITETGKAYALAPNVEPNIITEAQVLVKGENWIYGVIILMIFIAIVINSKQKAKK